MTNKEITHTVTYNTDRGLSYSQDYTTPIEGTIAMMDNETIYHILIKHGSDQGVEKYLVKSKIVTFTIKKKN